MESLRAWLDESIAERRVEPNSGLGQAIEYLRRYWHRLTLFLCNPGAPLDNNICERALKKAILHRKNALRIMHAHVIMLRLNAACPRTHPPVCEDGCVVL